MARKRRDILSAQLREYAKEIHLAKGTSDREFNRTVLVLMREFSGEVEGLARADRQMSLDMWSSNIDMWKQMVDAYYTRQFLARMPRLVDRFLKFAPVYVRPGYSKEINIYIREAGRCYIFGFPQARSHFVGQLLRPP